MLKFVISFLLFFHAHAQNKAAEQNCESAFNSAKTSTSTSEVTGAVEICRKAQVEECRRYTGDTNTGDNRYIAGVCGLNSAVAANKSANSNIVVESCLKAKKKAMQSPSARDLATAIEVCERETEKVCLTKKDGTGDGRLVSANCALNAAYGAFHMAIEMNKGGNKVE